MECIIQDKSSFLGNTVAQNMDIVLVPKKNLVDLILEAIQRIIVKNVQVVW